VDCLAAIERGDFGFSRAADAGASVRCPFCCARGAPVPAPGKQIIFLHGRRAGVLATVSAIPNTIDPEGFFVSRYGASEGKLERASLDKDLFATLPLDPIPNWCPPFDLRRAFIIDEVAVWFCNRGLVGRQFHWRQSDILTAVRVCWQKKLAVRSSELSAVMMAHGMPGVRQVEFERDFDFASAALVDAVGRKPIEKWRQPHGMHAEYAAAMRYWGR
jgi:hypothetical protein